MTTGHIVMLLDNPLKSDSRVEKEAASLLAAGYNVTIHAMHSEALPATEERNGYHIIRDISPSIDHPFSSEYRNFRERFVNMLSNQSFDALHCHDYKMIILGALIKKAKPSVKLVYDAHEFLPGWPMYQELSGFSNKIKGLLVWSYFVYKEKKAIKHANAVITVGPALAEEMKTEYHLSVTPTVLRNIPERLAFNTDSDYYKRLYNLPSNALVFIHSGNIYHSEERVQLMINAVMKIDRAYLVFIGDSKRIKELETANTNARVLFHPYAAQEQLFVLIHAADFGLVHTWQPYWRSHWLSLPNRIMEYTMVGLPIIATSQPEFMKLGMTYGNMVFYRGDAEEEMVKAIEMGISTQVALKRNAVISATSLSWEVEVMQLINLYRQL